MSGSKEEMIGCGDNDDPVCSADLPTCISLRGSQIDAWAIGALPLYAQSSSLLLEVRGTTPDPAGGCPLGIKLPETVAYMLRDLDSSFGTPFGFQSDLAALPDGPEIAAAAASVSATHAHEILFVDPGISDLDTLLEGVRPGVKAYYA